MANQIASHDQTKNILVTNEMLIRVYVLWSSMDNSLNYCDMAYAGLSHLYSLPFDELLIFFILTYQMVCNSLSS